MAYPDKGSVGLATRNPGGLVRSPAAVAHAARRTLSCDAPERHGPENDAAAASAADADAAGRTAVARRLSSARLSRAAPAHARRRV
jgi:hypothetical protein